MNLRRTLQRFRGRRGDPSPREERPSEKKQDSAGLKITAEQYRKLAPILRQIEREIVAIQTRALKDADMIFDRVLQEHRLDLTADEGRILDSMRHGAIESARPNSPF